jgi:hypothetical protein
MDKQSSHSEKRYTLAAVRLLAAIALLAVGGVHIQQYTAEDYRLIPTIGFLFLLNFIGGTVLGLYFLVPASRHASRARLIVDAVAATAGWFLAAGALIALLLRRTHAAVRLHGTRLPFCDRVRHRLRSGRDGDARHPDGR